MRKLFSPFEKDEVFIERGQHVDDFIPALRIDNTGIECVLQSVTAFREHTPEAMFEMHWEEVAQDKNWRQDLDWGYYQSLESLNLLRIVVLRIHGITAGYFLFCVSPALHYRGKMLASSDMFYILPQFRAKYAVRLFRAAEAYAKEAGAHKMYIAFKIYKDISPLTKRLDFTHVEDVVVKSLE
jgi:GNAT superfamily N-acetyltransferase